jgi:nucleotide-binding universal stress UspA family protein
MSRAMGVILVAFDGTASAGKAVERAVVLLAKTDSMVLLYVMPEGDTGPPTDFLCPEEPMGWEEANLLVNAAAAEAVQQHGVQAVGVVKKGPPGPTIVATAEELGAGVVVVGVGRVERVSCYSLGSVADYVARHSSKPVLIVR